VNAVLVVTRLSLSPATVLIGLEFFGTDHITLTVSRISVKALEMPITRLLPKPERTSMSPLRTSSQFGQFPDFETILISEHPQPPVTEHD
jgi:hypothetical protein